MSGQASSTERLAEPAAPAYPKGRPAPIWPGLHHRRTATPPDHTGTARLSPHSTSAPGSGRQCRRPRRRRLDPVTRALADATRRVVGLVCAGCGEAAARHRMRSASARDTRIARGGRSGPPDRTYSHRHRPASSPASAAVGPATLGSVASVPPQSSGRLAAVRIRILFVENRDGERVPVGGGR